ncbi:alpha/beta-hydrolase [Aureobasidium pullulans]|nr:alpha/beta-hydrolase [Aureobasidium pullulans]
MATSLVETASAKIPQLFPDAVYHKLIPAAEHPLFNYNGFKPEQIILQKGHVKSSGHRAFSQDVIYDRDITIQVRDGIKLYADVFRPADSDKSPVPVIIPWSPYGKTGTGPQNYDFMAPYRAGIAKDRTSGYEKFEAPDPAEWCERGYAVLNIDARGSGASEGDLAHWGLQEAEDVYDVIDFIFTQPWCSGSVCMAGNSWLSMAQINFVSRLSHPALKAIAPWESQTDCYRHFVARGGRPHIKGFHEMIKGGFAGPGSAELVFPMVYKRPFYDEYWEAKRFPVENIDKIPMYLTASYSTMLHTHGSFGTFRDAKTNKKWLRVHPYQEWYDIYRPDINDDLQRFYDFYCKNVQNGWEKDTPPLRLSLLGFESDGSNAHMVIERPENEWPIAREKQMELYLDASTKKLSTEPVSGASSINYNGHSLDSSADFTFFFDKATELAGYSKLTVYMSCDDHDDMDVVCQIRKVDATGRPLEHLNYPVPVSIAEVDNFNTAKTLGPQGFLRASHAITLDPSKSRGNDLYYRHDRREAIPRGEIVRLEIPLWPIGMVFAEGEGIMLRISGHDMSLPETDPFV